MLSENGKKFIITVSVLTPLASLLVILRIARRWRKLIGVDDLLLCLALVTIYAENVGGLLLAAGPEGKPMSSLTPGGVTNLLKLFYWTELLYTLLIGLIKFSILISYNRIFGRLQWFRRAVYTLGALEGMWSIGVIFSLIFQCTPVVKAWEPSRPGHCIPLVPFLWGNSITNCIIDYLILGLPIVPVWRLQMKPAQKIMVTLSFALGSIACIASTIRASLTSTVNTEDLSESVFQDAIWIYVEPSAGIISACLPFLASIFGQHLREVLNHISNFGSRTISLVRLRMKSYATTNVTQERGSGTHRAAHESYELHDDNDRAIPGFRDQRDKVESTEDLIEEILV